MKLVDNREPTENLPARRMSNRDFEMVIRRAAELQARDSEGSDSDGIEEAEVLRIGRELGLSTQHLHRALVEVKGSEADETGVFAKLFGPAHVRVGRTLRGDPKEIASVLEGYLVAREYMAVLRRMPDRVVFTRATGASAAVGRAMSKAFNRTPLLPVVNLEMASQRLEEGFSYVSLATSLSGQRTATATTSIVGGGSGTAIGAAVLGIAIAPPAALLALPFLAATMFGGHAYYSGVVRKVQIQLESLLDRLEHGELVRASGPWSPRKSLPAELWRELKE